MKKTLKYCLVFVLFSACQNVEKAPKPDNLIQEEKMVDILEDMILIEATLNLDRIDSQTKNFDPKKYLYEKYSIDSAQLVKSNAYYLENFEKSTKIYEQVRARLEKKQDQKDSLKTVNDSLRETEKKLPTKNSVADSARIFQEVELLDSLR